MKVVSSCFLTLIFIACVSATINPSKNKKTKQKSQPASVEVKIKTGPQENSVYDRNLVENEPLASEIIAEAGTYYKYTDLKNFNGTVLGFVTPVRFFIDFLSARKFDKFDISSGTLMAMM